MTQHHNPSITDDARRILNTSSDDMLPDWVEGPVAVVAIEPAIDIVRNLISTNGGDADIYVTPADKDFYLCHVQMCGIKDAASTCTQMVIRYTDAGTTRNILGKGFLTLTAETYSLIADFSTPIKMPRNTAIRLVHTGGGVTQLTHLTVMGYTRETTR